MLLGREEMTFDFQGARLEPARDREILAWMFNQFLYGEVTGIQVGHWLYQAPDLEAARFLSRQAVEEMQHVDNFLEILDLLGAEPKKPHAALRFLATGMMGASWAEHVALEMAAGEGFVLMALYGLIDTLDHPEAVAILARAVKQEERHVAFGEAETQKAIQGRPWLKRRLLGLNLVSMWAVGRLARFISSHVPKDHPVLSRMPAFLDHTLACAELRLRRTGLLGRPLAEVSAARRGLLVAEAYAGKALSALLRLLTLPMGKKRLTDTYLEDPHVVGRTRRLPGPSPDSPPDSSRCARNGS
jgi:hypothetical protein